MKLNRHQLFFSGGPEGRVGFLTLLILALTLTGCANGPTTQPVTEDQKQDEILKDPAGYKPTMNHDISGGGIGESHGIGTDIDHVLNP